MDGTITRNKEPEGDDSSSSDDDYLTLNDSSRDRESLVRKKLLENFYGKSAVAAVRPVVGRVEDEEYDDDLDDEDKPLSSLSSPRSITVKVNSTDRDDLDSPAFDAAAHTKRHVLHSKVRDLLEVEERLSLQVRTLESTMQTLVYENYSRFIDATDAIRSIGVNVQANEVGLKKLTQRIQSVDLLSKDTEEALGALRDQVAEKVRVKRLLSRLDALLKLPKTLRAQIAQGKYRTATRSYTSASTILRKHSQGFESLKNIETDCWEILLNMKRLLLRKILHWNGRLRDDVSAETGIYDENQTTMNEDRLPEPPKNMAEIFECVGTLHILFDDPTLGIHQSQPDSNDIHVEQDEFQSLAVGAATRALDRILDAHMIQVQERRLAPIMGGAGGDDVGNSYEIRQFLSSSTGTASTGAPTNNSNASGATSRRQPQGVAFVPREFLDAMLEVAKLFGMTFGATAQVGLLTDFIHEAFALFLAHVRSILLEESAHLKGINEDQSGTDCNTSDEDLSSALACLIHAVEEMVSGLSLPEVGIDADFCASMVKDAKQLTDSMVTRRVRQKFHDLRVNIIQDCLIPFSQKLVAEQLRSANNTDGGSPWSKESLSQARLSANTALSDCLQLVDDTVRSILSANGEGTHETYESGGAAPPATTDHLTNLPVVLKEAVEEGTKEFTNWLATALEVLAGGEASNTYWVIDVPHDGTDINHDGDEEKTEMASDETAPASKGNNIDIGDKDSEPIMELIQSARDVLLKGKGHNDVLENDETNDFAVAIAEMCRLAQGSVSINLEQSISTHLGTSKRRSRLKFADGQQLSTAQKSRNDEANNEVSHRFKLAASRIYALYASRKGNEAAALLAANLDQLSNEHINVQCPRACVCDALGIVKQLALECAGIFDCPSRAAPVSVSDSNILGRGGGSVASLGMKSNMKSSLQIDVERMFKEKIIVHLHPSEQLDFSRNALVFLLMKVAIRGFLESILMLGSFSVDGFKQLQVDVEFLKLMMPHYIDEDFSLHASNCCVSLSNLMSDVMEAASQRCLNESCGKDEDLHRESLAILHSFMTRVVSNNDIDSRFIIKEQ